MGGKKRQTGTTCRAPTSQRRLGCALARRGASVLADGFGPGTHRLPDTARRFLPSEGKFFHVRFWRAGGKAGLFPELLPLPDAGSFVEGAVAELVGEHQNLAAMAGLVREHVSEHGASGGPREDGGGQTGVSLSL